MNSATDQIKSDFLTKGFVHLRNEQPAAASDLLALAESFGPLLTTDRHTPDHPAIQIIGETGLFGDQDLPWHNDFSYGEGEFVGTLLSNREGGHLATTRFVDMEVAAATLPDEERERLRGLTGHYFLPAAMMSDFYTEGQERQMKRARSKRPLVFDHPATGRPVLYFSPGTLRRVTGGDVDIQALLQHCEKHAFEHHWQPGDILLYDNYRMMHARGPFQGQRTLWRIQFSPRAAAGSTLRSESKAVAG